MVSVTQQAQLNNTNHNVRPCRWAEVPSQGLQGPTPQWQLLLFREGLEVNGRRVPMQELVAAVTENSPPGFLLFSFKELLGAWCCRDAEVQL